MVADMRNRPSSTVDYVDKEFLGLGVLKNVVDQNFKHGFFLSMLQLDPNVTLVPLKALPYQAPVTLARALAFELSSGLAHPAATFRANAIHNAGNHILNRFDFIETNKHHTHLTHSQPHSQSA